MDSLHGTLEKPLPEKPLPRLSFWESKAAGETKTRSYKPFVTFKDAECLSQQSYGSKFSTHTIDYHSSSHEATSNPKDGVETGVPPTRRSLFRTLRRWWPQEAASWAAGILCYVAKVAVLFAFDGKSIPHLPFGITLNALISVLATLGVFFLMVPITAGLAQTKWIWFCEGHPLLDFEVIECASRGPGGSLLLLLKRRGGYLAMLGSLLTILLVATSPFVQQVIQYNRHLDSEPTGLVPIAKIFNTSVIASTAYNSTLAMASDRTVDVVTKAAFYTGALTSGPTTFNVVPSCPAGNCTVSKRLVKPRSIPTIVASPPFKDFVQTFNPLPLKLTYTLKWEPYQTLSFCTECKTVLWPKGLHAEASLYQNGVYSETINHTLQIWAFPPKQVVTEVYMGLNPNSPDLNPWHPVSAFDNYKGPMLADLFINVLDGDPTIPYMATLDECVFSLCVKTFRATFLHGVFKETEISTALNPFDWPSEREKLEEVIKEGTNCNYDCIGLLASNRTFDFNMTITPTDSNETFAVPHEMLSILVTWLVEVFTCSNDPQSATNVNGIIQAMAATMGRSNPYKAKDWLANIASSMSKSMRMQPNAGGNAIGTSYSYSDSLVDVRWVWMTYPIVVLVLGMTFYTSVLQTSKVKGAPRWKDNSLASLLHGIDDYGRDAIRSRGYGHAHKLEEMEDAARRMRVRMARIDGKSWHLVGCEDA